MVGTTERAKTPPSGRDAPRWDCVAGECVWKVASEHRSFEDMTPHGRRLSAYLLDLSGLCACPHRPVSRRI